MVCASRPAARLLRTAAPFELPGGYFGTTRPIIRLVVDPIIRVVLYYQPKADNPADNPAVSFVVYSKLPASVRKPDALTHQDTRRSTKAEYLNHVRKAWPTGVDSITV